MEERLNENDSAVSTVTGSSDFNQQLPIDQSKPFIGQWNRLVSTTNWEKGEIIIQWRESLESDSDEDSGKYSDDAWSRMVGDVTAQHVGRLRRTYSRFSKSYSQYEGLYWSHFYAALEWDDAEMWLEGAVQNRWSVSRMRRQRWETLGKIPENEPRVADVVVSELDEGFQPLQFDRQIRADDQPGLQGPPSEDIVDRTEFTSGPRPDGPDFGDEPASASASPIDASDADMLSASAAIEPERLFENLHDLPEDVGEAAESMKLAILRHKMSEWEEIPKSQMLQLLDALKQLIHSPEDAKAGVPENVCATDDGDEE